MSAAASSKVTEPAPNSRGQAGAKALSPRYPYSLGLWPTVGAVVLVSLAAISTSSLWIDEAATAVQAMQPTLAAWWRLLLEEKTAHLQMPLYMLYIWGYAKAFGASEWALRLANLPWFVAGAVAFVLQFFTEDRRRVVALLVVLLCPFAWYYLDEARPYAMELGASLLVVASLGRLARHDSDAKADAGWLTLLVLAVVVLSATSLLGMIWAAGGLAAVPVLVSWPRIMDFLRKQLVLCCVAGGVLVLLGGYYVWTLLAGARATAPSTSSIGSVGFIMYEVLGFAGLGPGRLDLRSAGLRSLHGYWAWLGLYGTTCAVVIGAALLALARRSDRRLLLLGLCAGAPAAFIIGAGWVVHFRVLGRHFTPLVPVILLLFTNGLAVLWARPLLRSRVWPVLFCGLSLVSCLSFRFAPRHERDDYRAAAAVAKAALAESQSVWWSAAIEGAKYYGVPLARGSAAQGQALLVANPGRESLLGLAPPEVIIASKPDVYDGRGAIAEYIRDHGYQQAGTLPAFVIWKKHGK